MKKKPKNVKWNTEYTFKPEDVDKAVLETEIRILQELLSDSVHLNSNLMSYIRTRGLRR